MHPNSAPDPFAGWRPLQLAREREAVGGDGRTLTRAVASGAAIRLRRGVAVDAVGWADVSAGDKYLLRLRAVAATRQSAPVFSHQSAAVLWGIPIIGRWPNEVHLMAEGQSGRHSKNGVVWHHQHLRDDEVVEVQGMLVTSLLRTLIDLAHTTSFLSAVASIDYGTRPHLLLPGGISVPGVERDALIDCLASQGRRRGVRAAREAVSFSDNRSGSPGESLSRGQIFLCGFPAPDLQVSFVGEGHEDIVDFRWEQKQEVRIFTLNGEFDGFIKYTRDEYTRGRPMEEVVWSEKLREDRVRRTSGSGMARWVWEIALHRELLRRLLLNAGLRPER